MCQKKSHLMVLRGFIISVLSLNQATLGWGLPPLERHVTLIMSPWLIDPDMSPCIWGSPGGSADNLSYYSQFFTLTRRVETQVECWVSPSHFSTQNNQTAPSFDQNCVASTQESDGSNWICKRRSKWTAAVHQLTIDGEANSLLHGCDPPQRPVFHSAANSPTVVLRPGPELEGVGGVPGLLPVLLQPGGDLVGVLWK